MKIKNITNYSSFLKKTRIYPSILNPRERVMQFFPRLKVTGMVVVMGSLALMSCSKLAQKMVLKSYGFKSPAIENATSINKAALKFGFDTTGIYTVNASDFLKTLEEAQGIPECAIYNAKGEFIPYRDSIKTCNGWLFDIIPSLKKDSTYASSDKFKLQTELKKLRTVNGNPIASNLENYDYYLFVFWTTWSGKLNKDHVKIWEDLALKNTKAKIKVMKINLDAQSYWPEKDKQEILKILKKKFKF